MAILNEYLTQFKGETINDRITKDCSKFLHENKKLSPSEACLIQVCDPKTKEILGIGGSEPSDLFLTFLGEFWEFFWRVPFSGGLTNQYTDTSNILRTVQMQGVGGGFFPYSQGSTGTGFQVGSGSTAPARTDIGIENPFITSPESGILPTGNGFYDSVLGTISASTLIVAGGSGTISEAVAIWKINTTANVGRFFAWARDLISPSVSFVPANTITITWTWQL